MQKKLSEQQQNIYRFPFLLLPQARMLVMSQYLRGFTLTELIIVIAVSLVLLTVGFSVLNPTKQINRGNDARRKADLITIQSALERYYADVGDYPGVIGWCAQISHASFPQVQQSLMNYLKKVPQDPKYAGTTKDYYYWHFAPRQYRFYATIENTADPDFVTQALVTDGATGQCTGVDNAYNYRLVNP